LQLVRRWLKFGHCNSYPHHKNAKKTKQWSVNSSDKTNDFDFIWLCTKVKLPCTLYKIPVKVIIKNVLRVRISKARNAGTCNKSKVKLQCMSSTPDLNFQLSEMLIRTHFEHPKLIYLTSFITDWLIGLRCFCDYCETDVRFHVSW
jgi:hypothetical protein